MKFVVFDLDDTLVSSGHLRSLRDAQAWDAVERKIDSVQPFADIPKLLSSLRDLGIKIGIATSSPQRYARAVLDQCSLQYDALVAAGDTTHGKPNAEPTQAALDRMGCRNSEEAIAIGDRCVDIASAKKTRVRTIGAIWGACNVRDLKTAWPDYLATTPDGAAETISTLASGESLAKLAWFQDFEPKLWIDTPDWDNRHYLSIDGIRYRFARIHYGGSTEESAWRRSNSSQLIFNLKAKQPNQRHHKISAAGQFARELDYAIPKDSWVIFVMPSALKGSDDYDDRWELVRAEVDRLGTQKVRHFRQAIEVHTASVPAHEQPGASEDRDPETIKGRVRWVGGIPREAEHVAIIDDVVTKGGHLRAYYDITRENCPNAEITLLSWAAFTSEPWHSCVAGRFH